MISDISSACYEWFHFDRPIVYANPSPENYRPVNDISANTFAWQAGDVLYKFEDILPVLTRNLEEDIHKETRNEIFNYSIFSPDGKATQRQAKKILELYKSTLRIPYWLISLSMRIRHSIRYKKVSIAKRLYQSPLQGGDKINDLEEDLAATNPQPPSA